MYNRFNFKTAGVKLANPANSYPESSVNKVLNGSTAYAVDTPEIDKGFNVRLDTPITTTSSNKKLNVV